MPRLTQPQLDRKWRGHLDDYVTAIAWSPDSQQVAACDGAGSIQCLNLATQKTHYLQTADGQSIDVLEYSHDGRFLAASGQDGNILIWEMTGETPNLITRLDHPRTWVDHLAWHPRRAELAFSLGRYAQIWDAQTHEIVTTLSFEASSVLGLAWHKVPFTHYFSSCFMGSGVRWLFLVFLVLLQSFFWLLDMAALGNLLCNTPGFFVNVGSPHGSD